MGAGKCDDDDNCPAVATAREQSRAAALLLDGRRHGGQGRVQGRRWPGEAAHRATALAGGSGRTGKRRRRQRRTRRRSKASSTRSGGVQRRRRPGAGGVERRRAG
ncbi:hypothetical protein E2562_025912 [Oryza meyeriana var. granulata]|uniref:Uncharacterized protein n=1 Tax=Oryza meyeriana var. granulata TaxID=110450 RepID=A0A6G1CII2_9ORYZ|nr:hypothetical protein E2562_025912 [Oryza meyeriana var. granulata]